MSDYHLPQVCPVARLEASTSNTVVNVVPDDVADSPLPQSGPGSRLVASPSSLFGIPALSGYENDEGGFTVPITYGNSTHSNAIGICDNDDLNDLDYEPFPDGSPNNSALPPSTPVYVPAKSTQSTPPTSEPRYDAATEALLIATVAKAFKSPPTPKKPASAANRQAEEAQRRARDIITAMATQANEADIIKTSALETAEDQKMRAAEETRQAKQREEMAHKDLAESRAKNALEKAEKDRIVEKVKSMEGGEDLLDLMDVSYTQALVCGDAGGINGNAEDDEDEWSDSSAEDDDTTPMNAVYPITILSGCTYPTRAMGSDLSEKQREELKEKYRMERELFSCWSGSSTSESQGSGPETAEDGGLTSSYGGLRRFM